MIDLSLRLDVGDGIFYAGLFYFMAVLVTYAYNYWYYKMERKRSAEYLQCESKSMSERVTKLEALWKEE